MDRRVHIEDGDKDRAFLGQTGWVLVMLNLWHTILGRLISSVHAHTFISGMSKGCESSE